MKKTIQLYARRLLVVGAAALALALLWPDDSGQAWAALTIAVGVITVAALPPRPIRLFARRKAATRRRTRARAR